MLGGQPFLQGLPEPLDLALGLRVVRLAVLLRDPEPGQLMLQAVAAAAAAPANRAVYTVPLSVNVDAGTPWAAQAARNEASTTGPLTRTCADRCSTNREWSSGRVQFSV
jgi:hypothetical protein